MPAPGVDSEIVRVPPDGYVAWAGNSGAPDLAETLAQWFGQT